MAKIVVPHCMFPSADRSHVVSVLSLPFPNDEVCLLGFRIRELFRDAEAHQPIPLPVQLKAPYEFQLCRRATRLCGIPWWKVPQLGLGKSRDI
jgi:hypothetical protein